MLLTVAEIVTGGATLGLRERVLTTAQALVPLAVVLGCACSRRSCGNWSSRHSFCGLASASLAASSSSRPRSSTRRILPEIVFGQLGELDPADPLPRREVLAGIPQDRDRRLLGGLMPRRSTMYALGTARRTGSGRRHDGGLGDGQVLDEHRLQLERADLVVAGLEDVVGTADVRDVASLSTMHDVTGVVIPADHGLGIALVVALVAGHQRRQQAVGQVGADLAFTRPFLQSPKPVLP